MCIYNYLKYWVDDLFIASGYMSVDTRHAIVGQHIPLASPPFEAHTDNCLLFDYKVWAASHTLVDTPAPRLEVYISGSSHVYSVLKLWVSNGTGEGHMKIPIWAQPGSLQRISFVGVVGDPESTAISVAHIRLNVGRCAAVDCIYPTCEKMMITSILSANSKCHI